MNRKSLEESIVFVLLVAAAVLLRVLLEGLPNFAPAAAAALFAGYYFRSRAMALCVPLAVMLLSDQIIGGYQPLVMVTVYAALALPVLLRPLLRRHLSKRLGSFRQGMRSSLWLAGGSLACSLVFFAATNFAVWLTWYQPTTAELARCYLNALPFLRFTILGDLTFSFALFGAYALAVNSGLARQQTSGPALARGMSS